MFEDADRPEFMAEGETLETGEFAVGEGPTAGVVGTISGCCDTSGGSVAGIRPFGASSGVVDVMVGPVGGD